ncbi:hypothetical protein MAM1_0025c02053 [Mucor ambiguus]|uniref:GATA-type domain-containing protein n=1 Tax=Mucor ambiguus TaxID=91626 RepID=A0A0C9M6W6_9FUNG|nr:hypothetical protein MAM1_0025c02053 [Mucor ambiguus]
MTIQSSCFWSLLSLDSLEFVHIPSSIRKIKIATENNQTTIQDVLMHRSLFEFMHPSEIGMAKNDLSSFLKLKTLAGSVTRCRLLSLKSMACHVLSKNSSQSSDYQDWHIIDLVIYTATDDTVLAFFHNTGTLLLLLLAELIGVILNTGNTIDFGSCHFNDTPMVSNPSCTTRSDKACFSYEDALRLTQVLKLIPETPIMQMMEDHQLDNPIRIFQIIDSFTLKPLFVWPQLYSFVDMIQSLAKETVLREFKSQSNEPSPNIAAATEDVSCTRHFYANSKIELSVPRRACEFQRILIPYGNILFESIQVTPLPIVTTTTLTLGRQHTGMYMNSFTLYYNLQRVLKSDDEKEEVDRKQPSSLQYKYTNDGRSIVTPDSGPSQAHSNQVHSASILHSSIAPVASIHSPSSHLRKFRIQQQHTQHNAAIRQRNSSCSSTEKKRRNDAFQGPVAITSPDSVKTCTRCHTSDSPEWRRGPDGHKTLCNACGLRYSRFRSKQWRTATTNSSTSPPANSPFSSIK